ncbi:TonB-dependent receptor domain-containing protein [Paraglaciecola aestuariivivens]
MFTNSKMAKSIRLAMAAGVASTAMLASHVVNAQQDADAEQNEKSVEKISVTGSRIKSQNFESASPVSVTSDVEIKLSGFTRIEDLMNSLPQIEAGQTSFISNGASGTANLDLRGLGPTRTLVLVNGRRLQPGGVYSQSPDINQIPAALVKRVEVLTGGGSSTYGADAVAGVVNFVMDDQFEGIELTVGASGYQHNNNNSYIQGLMDARNFEYPDGNSGIDGKSYNIDFTAGGTFADGKGHAVAYATWRRNDELRQAARDYSSCALNNAGNSCGGSLNTIIPSFFIGDIDPATGIQDDYELWSIDSNSAFIPQDGTRYNYAPVNHFMRPDERFSIGAFVDYEVNEHFNPYMEVSYMNDRTVAQIAESGTFFAEQYNLDVSNPLLNDTQRQQLMDRFNLTMDDQFSVYIGKRNVEGGPRASSLEHNSFRIVLGSEGDINDMWSYDASFQYGSSSSSAAYLNDFFAPRIATALDPDLCAATAGCLPYEVFTFNGITPEAAATLTGVAILNGVTSNTILNAYVSGDTGMAFPSAEDTVQVVFGMEHRKEEFERLSDEVFARGLLLGQGGATASIVGDYSVNEIFAEAQVPVIQGADGAENLVLDLGYRYSDYDTSGGVSTYKVGVNYEPMDDFKVRASYNRAVRAPNVGELFAPQNTGLWNGTDPCGGIIADGETPAQTAAQCANSGVTASQYGNIALSPASQYNGLFGGNPDLQPEVADTYTFGVAANPFENFAMSVDYWDIELNDVIGAVGSQLTVEQCGLTGDPAYCDNVVRAGSGSLWRGTAGFVRSTNVNLAGRRWQGVDFSGNYEAELGEGTITAKFVGTLMTKKEYDPIPGDDSAKYDCAGEVSVNCFAQPEWRHSLSVTYTTGEWWSVDAKWRYYGDVGYNLESTDTLTVNNGGIDAQSYLDLKASFDVNENLGVLVGVNNVLDKEPPMVGGTLSSNANTVAGFYDTLGRYLHASATYRF